MRRSESRKRDQHEFRSHVEFQLSAMRSAAEGCEGGGVVGEEVADYDAHGAGGNRFAGGIVVSVGDGENVSAVERETAAGGRQTGRRGGRKAREKFDGHRKDLAGAVEIRGKRADGFVRGGVLEGEPFAVIVEMAADPQEAPGKA